MTDTMQLDLVGATAHHQLEIAELAADPELAVAYARALIECRAGEAAAPFSGEPAPTPERERPPNRRQLVRHRLKIGEQTYAVDIGLSPLGRPVELFISGPAAGSELATIAHDAATVISVSLQHGVPPAVLAKSVARQPGQLTEKLEFGLVGDPATIIGAVLDLLARADEEPSLL